MSERLRVAGLVLLLLALSSLACSGSSGGVTVRESGEEAAAAEAEVPASAAAEPTPTSAPLGSARSNPAPAGSEVEVEGLLLQVLEVERPVDDQVAAANMFNPEPEEGHEYILVRLRVACLKGGDDTCRLPLTSFKVVGDSGVVCDAKLLVSGMSGLLESRELFGGAEVEGAMVFEVPQGDAGLVLMYDPFLGRKAYLALP